MPRGQYKKNGKKQNDSSTTTTTTTTTSSPSPSSASLPASTPSVLAALPNSPGPSLTSAPLSSLPGQAPNLLVNQPSLSPSLSLPAPTSFLSPATSSSSASQSAASSSSANRSEDSEEEEFKQALINSLFDDGADMSIWDDQEEHKSDSDAEEEEEKKEEKEDKGSSSGSGQAQAQAAEPWQMNLASWNTQGKPGFDIRRVPNLMGAKDTDVLVLSEMKGKEARKEMEDLQAYQQMEEDEREQHKMHEVYGPILADYDIKDIDVSESGNRNNQEYIRAIARREADVHIANARAQPVPGQLARPAAAFDVVKGEQTVSVNSFHAPYDKGSEAAPNYMRSLMQDSNADVLLGDTNVYSDGNQGASASSSGRSRRRTSQTSSTSTATPRRSSRAQGGSSVGGGVGGYQNVSGGMQTSRGDHSLDKVYASEGARSKFAFEVGSLAQQQPPQDDGTNPRKRKAKTKAYNNSLEANAPDHRPIRVTLTRPPQVEEAVAEEESEEEERGPARKKQKRTEEEK